MEEKATEEQKEHKKLRSKIGALTDLSHKGSRKSALPSINRRYKVDEVKKVIYDCYGVRTYICATLDCTQDQFQAWLYHHPECKEDLLKAREGIVNLAEDVIIKSLQSSDEKIRLDAAKTTLRSLGRNYGWGDGAWPLAINVQQDADSKKVQVQAIFGIGQQEDSK